MRAPQRVERCGLNLTRVFAAVKLIGVSFATIAWLPQE